MFYAYYCATSTPRRNANNCYGPIESNSNGVRDEEEEEETEGTAWMGSDRTRRFARDSGIE